MSAAEAVRSSRVLFVDDEPRVLDGLRRMLLPLRSQWEMVFASGPEEALRLASQEPFDVVVSDMRMPVMTGADLLRRISQISPGTVRIMLSGQSEVSAILRAVGPSHRFLSKPCDPGALKQAVAEAIALREHLASARLRELLGGIGALPTLPSTYTELVAAIDRDAPCQQIAQIVSRDMAASVEILKLVNSGYFGGGRAVSDPVRAVLTLGTDTVQAIVLGAGLFEQLAAGMAQQFASLWETSQRATIFARRICLAEKVDQAFTSQATLGSLVHDVGVLILRRHAPDLWAETQALQRAEALPEQDAERRVIGATHSDVGAHLLRLWGFPDPLLEAVAFHHSPARAAARDLAPVAVVHAAQAFAHGRARRTPENGEAAAPELDLAYFESIGASERVAAWAELCGGDSDE